MSTAPAPRRIEWAGPDGWSIWADEDGVHLRTPKGDGLEMPDVVRLFDVWSTARGLVAADAIPAPKVPTREEIHWRAEEYAKKRAIRAVEAEFNPPQTAPF